jgi:hypothetical protein
MPTPPQIVGNVVTMGTGADITWEAPQGTKWFFNYGSTCNTPQIAFNNEAPILFPRRTLRVGKIDSVTFKGGTPGTLVFTSGIGDPPEYPSIDDAGIVIIDDPNSPLSVVGGGSYAIPQEGYFLRAIWVSIPAGQANGLWVSTGGVSGSGIYIPVGVPTRLMVSLLGNVAPQISNSGAGAISFGISYEHYT